MPMLVRTAAALVALTAIAAGLAGCSSQTDASSTSSPDPRLVGAWHLRAGSDARGAFALGDTDITLTIGGNRPSGGRSACTRYSAQLTGGIGAVFVTTRPVLSDRCQSIPSAVLDSRYLRGLTETRLAGVRDGVLTLQSQHGVLQFTQTGKATTLAGYTWVLDSLSGATSEWLAKSVQGAASLRFSRDGTFQVSTTCATLTANYTVVDDQVSVGDYSEDVGNGGICNDKTGAVGAQVMSLLGGRFSYQIVNGALDMTASGLGTSATFKERGANVTCADCG